MLVGQLRRAGFSVFIMAAMSWIALPASAQQGHGGHGGGGHGSGHGHGGGGYSGGHDHGHGGGYSGGHGHSGYGGGGYYGGGRYGGGYPYGGYRGSSFSLSIGSGFYSSSLGYGGLGYGGYSGLGYGGLGGVGMMNYGIGNYGIGSYYSDFPFASPYYSARPNYYYNRPSVGISIYAAPSRGYVPSDSYPAYNAPVYSNRELGYGVSGYNSEFSHDRYGDYQADYQAGRAAVTPFDATQADINSPEFNGQGVGGPDDLRPGMVLPDGSRVLSVGPAAPAQQAAGQQDAIQPPAGEAPRGDNVPEVAEPEAPGAEEIEASDDSEIL